MDGLFGIFSRLKDMVDVPVKIVHIPKPMKHGVNVISFVEDPYLFIVIAEITDVIIAPMDPYNVCLPKSFLFSPNAANVIPSNSIHTRLNKFIAETNRTKDIQNVFPYSLNSIFRFQNIVTQC